MVYVVEVMCFFMGALSSLAICACLFIASDEDRKDEMRESLEMSVKLSFDKIQEMLYGLISVCEGFVDDGRMSEDVFADVKNAIEKIQITIDR